MRELVKSDFYPFAEARGFVRAKSTHPLFAVFRRFDGQKVQVFNVQWDKYGEPRFVVNFGEGPRSGVELWGKHIPGEALEPQDCPESGRLQRRPGASMGCWFQLTKPFLEAARTLEWRYPAAAVVDQLLAAFPEVEAWWQDRRIGPHITVSSPDLWRAAANAKRAAG